MTKSKRKSRGKKEESEMKIAVIEEGADTDRKSVV